MEQDEPESIDTSNGGENSNVWKPIWRMRVSNRVKSLVWRAETNSLPTRVNLVWRQILTEAVCQECKVQPEDTLHALWSCSNLKDTWKVHFGKLMIETSTCSSFLEILECASAEKSSFDLFAMMIFEFWQHQNKVRVGETVLLLRFLPRHMVLSKNFSNYAPFILKFEGQPMQ